jgi:hypothetical protein
MNKVNNIKIEYDRGDYQKDEPWCAPCIKENTGNNCKQVTEPAWKKVINKQKNRQEIQQENATAENHINGDD